LYIQTVLALAHKRLFSFHFIASTGAAHSSLVGHISHLVLLPRPSSFAEALADRQVAGIINAQGIKYQFPVARCQFPVVHSTYLL
jgi:hypothetical protein